MGAVNTAYTFTTTDVITSTKMNNIIDQTVVTSDAIFGNTLEVVSGKLKIRSQGVTSTELASGSVITDSIRDLNVTTGKIADANVTTGKIADAGVTAAKLAASSVETAKIKNANVTAAKLDGAQTGSAPIYGVRAWGYVESNGSFIRGAGIASVSKVTTGHYLVTLSKSAGGLFCAVASCGETNNYNNSAKVDVDTGTQFRVYTGFGNDASPSDSSFHFMVMY